MIWLLEADIQHNVVCLTQGPPPYLCAKIIIFAMSMSLLNLTNPSYSLCYDKKYKNENERNEYCHNFKLTFLKDLFFFFVIIGNIFIWMRVKEVNEQQMNDKCKNAAWLK